VLESVVQDEHVGAEGLPRVLSRHRPLRARQNRDVEKAPGDEDRLVARLLRPGEDLPAVGYDQHGGCVRPPIAAAQHGRPKAPIPQHRRELDHHGRLARAAHGEISDTHHGAAHPFLLQNAEVEQAVPGTDRGPVGQRQQVKKDVEGLAELVPGLPPHVSDQGFHVWPALPGARDGPAGPHRVTRRSSPAPRP